MTREEALSKVISRPSLDFKDGAEVVALENVEIIIKGIYEVLEKEKTCDGCRHRREGEVYPLGCIECSRFYADGYES